ncbi:hypothetical protein RJ639_039514 [Escallonia herrerae]|uniref:Uncharacterized protein n=1 Tax=Escallonia herrerae TaxID=1293975 RepID=A0AA88WLY5_9ASTE|nr:hypothetical protein RJ639_039514 [Escallonia herrerae]
MEEEEDANSQSQSQSQSQSVEVLAQETRVMTNNERKPHVYLPHSRLLARGTTSAKGVESGVGIGDVLQIGHSKATLGSSSRLPHQSLSRGQCVARDQVGPSQPPVPVGPGLVVIVPLCNNTKLA